jgi:hypothetical protein
MRRRGFRRLAAIAIPLGLAGCVSLGGAATPGTPASEPNAPTSTPGSLPGTPGEPMKLSVQNGTTLEVTLVVNGAVIEKLPPGDYEDPIKASLPPLPWSVEARSPSGRVLSTMTVKEGDYQVTHLPDGGGSAKGDAVRVDLSCGRLDVWYGTPMLGGTFMPGQSGDCD